MQVMAFYHKRPGVAILQNEMDSLAFARMMLHPDILMEASHGTIAVSSLVQRIFCDACSMGN